MNPTLNSNSHKREINTRLKLCELGSLIESYPIQLYGECCPGTWVKLSGIPSSFYFDEAIVLCQESENSWLAWIPEYGEIVLHAI